ncbi:MAG: hypothetical protein KF764_28245 [Labilithrix sp.]|nr:hypothetical protein [Labilithrix sp.]
MRPFPQAVARSLVAVRGPARIVRVGLVASLVALSSLLACDGDDGPAAPGGDELPDAGAADAAPAGDSGADASPDGAAGGGLGALGRVIGQTVLALSSDRMRIYGWGSNVFDVIRKAPSETQYDRPVSLDIDGMPAGPFRQVVSSGDKTCVVTEAGRGYCVGDTGANDSLGNGDSESHVAAVALAVGDIPAGVKIVAIDVSAFTSCVVGDDGEAYCWGDFRRVPVLDPEIATVTVPRRILRGQASGKIVDVSTAINRSCILADGRAYCWNLGQPEIVGQGELPPGTKLSKLRINDDFSCSPADDGEIYCWGTASGLRFGNGTTEFQSGSPYTKVSRANLPTSVRFKDVAVGGIAGALCGLGTDGWAYCWGSGRDGSVGDGDLTDHDVLAPKAVVRGQVPDGVTFVGLACGTYHTSALGSDGVVYSWGLNEGAVLAVPTAANPAVASPVRMSPLADD